MKILHNFCDTYFFLFIQIIQSKNSNIETEDMVTLEKITLDSSACLRQFT